MCVKALATNWLFNPDGYDMLENKCKFYLSLDNSVYIGNVNDQRYCVRNNNDLFSGAKFESI